MNVEWILGFAICMFGLAAVLWYLVRDIVFYWRNGWNFDMDSGVKAYWDEYDDGPEMPNRQRLFLGYPFILAVILIMLVVCWTNWPVGQTEAARVTPHADTTPSISIRQAL